MTRANDVINWIKDYYKDNPDGKAIIGISGGKDSTIAAALCVAALGADRVIGVMMPQDKQKDIADSKEVCDMLGIIPLTINIGLTCTTLMDWIAGSFTFEPHKKKYINSVNEVISNPMIKTNLPARIRMTTLYAVAALYPNSRVVNTCNRSEDYVGYSTKFGDAAGDFSPLGNLTVREVLAIGDELGLPEHLVHKAPSDGMCGKTDEDNLGFTYEQLDDYILGTGAVDVETVAKIERLHKATRHKYQPMPTYDPYAEKTIALGRPTYDIDFDNEKPSRGLRAEIGIITDECAIGGLVNDANMQGHIGTFTIDPLYHSTPNYDGVDLEKIAEAMQKVIDTAGCGILKERK